MVRIQSCSAILTSFKIPWKNNAKWYQKELYLGNAKDCARLSEEEKRDIESAKKEWMMLFQMGTIGDDSFELMFGDGGYIYFWIKKTDLLNRNYENVWLILQCG